MELNLAVLSSVRMTTCREQPPSVERVQLRETRSSYFLNLILQGLRKEDIELEMEKDRCLVIRGQRYSEEMQGMARWKWRVVESGSPRKAFKVPEDVNVGGIRASFEHGLLHLSMPKLTHNTFTPYHVFHIHSSHPHPHPHHRPHVQPSKQHEELAPISEDADVMGEPLSTAHAEEEDGKIMGREVGGRTECAPAPAFDDSLKKEVCVSRCENEDEDGEEERGVEGEERGGGSSLKMKMNKRTSSGPDAQPKPGPLFQDEDKKEDEKEKKRNYEKVNEIETHDIGNGNVENEMSVNAKPFLCQGLPQILSAIAAIVRRKRRCR